MHFRFAYARITSENTRLLKDITILDLSDLEDAPTNRIISIYHDQTKQCLKCPHHIIKKIVNIVKIAIDESQDGNNMETHGDTRYSSSGSLSKSINKEDTNTKEILRCNEELKTLLSNMQEKLEKLEEKIETFKSVRE